jgi:hypothetical protein
MEEETVGQALRKALGVEVPAEPEPRYNALHVRLTPAERGAITEAAEAVHLAVSSWARMVLMEAARKRAGAYSPEKSVGTLEEYREMLEAAGLRVGDWVSGGYIPEQKGEIVWPGSAFVLDQCITDKRASLRYPMSDGSGRRYAALEEVTKLVKVAGPGKELKEK